MKMEPAPFSKEGGRFRILPSHRGASRPLSRARPAVAIEPAAAPVIIERAAHIGDDVLGEMIARGTRRARRTCRAPCSRSCPTIGKRRGRNRSARPPPAGASRRRRRRPRARWRRPTSSRASRMCGGDHFLIAVEMARDDAVVAILVAGVEPPQEQHVVAAQEEEMHRREQPEPLNHRTSIHRRSPAPGRRPCYPARIAP